MSAPDIVFIPDGHTVEDCPCQPSTVPSWSRETGLVMLTGHHPKEES